MPKSKFTFSVASEYVVIGHDGEFADFDNPRGAIHAERFYMVAEDVDGKQYRFGNEKSEEDAEIVFVHFAPAVSEWEYFRCAYGSRAYMQNDCEDDQRRSEMEADLGPDWRNHPQAREVAMYH